jgi:hypothetical protein
MASMAFSVGPQRVRFIVATLGRQADPFTLHIYAAVAEQRSRSGA